MTVQTEQGLIQSVTEAVSPIEVTQASVLSLYNIPADKIQVTYGGINIPYRRTSQRLEATQAVVLAVVRGVIDNPKLNSWYFTLDGHDFWVLKLGTAGKTLVFDISTGQWSWWTTEDSPRWRASTGMNWRSAGSIPSQYGTNVIVGDDSLGVLWVLDPLKGTDDSPVSENQLTFPRVATGQLINRDRNLLQIFSVDLVGSLGQPALTANSVSLSYSDDQGSTYVEADEPLVIQEGSFDQDLYWYSLGLVRSPGRLFRISDNGALARIDGLYINE